MKRIQNFTLNPYLALILATLFMILGSAKWTFAPAPWLGLCFLLYFVRKVKTWKAIVLGIMGLYISGLIGVMEVFPAPMEIFAVFMIIGSAIGILPYLIDQFTKAEEKGFWGTLIFPSAIVSFEFLGTLGDGHVWTSVANTQYQFVQIQQIASIFGIWGITFLIAWFASVLNWIYKKQFEWKLIRKGVLIAGSVYLLVLVYGFWRSIPTGMQETVKIGALTMDNTNMIEAVYQETYKKTISIAPDASQSSPEVQEANQAFVKFIEDPYAPGYANSLSVMRANLDFLFAQTRSLADQGAKVVVWSEAIGLVMNKKEESVIQKAQSLAREKGIYLFMSVAVINPGPADPDRLLLKNKVLTITPEGEVANEYLKTHGVPFAEQDYGSDGIIPVIETEYGNLSPIICYDANFPHFVKQTAENGTDILLIPSGDWKAIDPYHAYMARMRSIENGVSIVRPVSRAVSIATDPHGNVVASEGYFDSYEKTLLAEVPVKGVKTIYSQIGDVLAYLCVGFLGFVVVRGVVRKVGRKKTT